MNITPTIHKRSNSVIDLVISLKPDQILEILSKEYVQPKRGRPNTLPAIVMDELYKEIDANQSTAILADKYAMSISTINRFKRLRKSLVTSEKQ